MEKFTKAQLLSFCFMSVCSGLTIGIGGSAFLLASRLYGVWGKLVGATLFSLGILAIVMFDMKLFTGLISYIPESGVKNLWKLPVCFLGNMLGVFFAAFLLKYTSIASEIIPEAQKITQSKLNSELWGLKAFCSSIFCGFLITLSIGSAKYSPRKGLSVTVGVMLPIIVFAFCGFDHSVANTFYFFFQGFSWKAVGYILLCIFGNIVGGVILPIFTLFRAAADKRAEENEKK